MSEHMTTDERNLYFYLLDTPLVPDGECPEWYRTLSASARLRIPPWVLESDEEPTPEIRALWKERALSALQVEIWAETIKEKNPDWFKEPFDRSSNLLNQIKRRKFSNETFFDF